MSQTLLNTLICLAGVLLLVGTVFLHDRRSFLGKLITKPFLSSLFVAAAWLQSSSQPYFARWVFVALGLCLIGDICMIFSAEAVFLIGLIFFLLGHFAYIAAFFSLASFNAWSIAGFVLVGLISPFVYSRLRPSLGAMKVPVAFYGLVISLMVMAAVTVFGDGRYPLTGRLMVTVGPLAFYASDVFVAREQFLSSRRINLLIGLPLYYIGQFLVAFSIGVIA